MRKISDEICNIFFTTALTTFTYAQQSTYYTDRWGQPAGQAWTYGNQTFYSDAIGRPTGSAATNGPNPPQPMGMPYPQVEPLRIEPIRPIRPIRPIEPIQPLRLQ